MKDFSNNANSAFKIGTFVGAIFTGLFGAAIGVSNLVAESNKIKEENKKKNAATSEEAPPASSTKDEQKK